MKKICLVTLGIYLNLLCAFSQVTDTTNYKSRKLKLEEVNLVSSYYRQDGNNSTVDGGIGSEKLTDLAGVIDIKFTKYDKRNLRHSFIAEVGVDHYTSASSDKIDTKANSSASSADTRFYPSLSWSVENEKKRTSFGLHASMSTEFDYTSIGFGASFSKKSKDRNREFGIRGQVFLDRLLLILPVELRPVNSFGDEESYPSASRNSYSSSFTLSQVVNKRFQLLWALDIIKQQGFLGLPFHRVILNDGTVRSEQLPSNRIKFPVSVRANYFAGDKIVLRSFYRFYYDDWGIRANTFDLETSYKINSFFSVIPFYRFYNQSAVDYFSPYKTHTVTDKYYTSNYDLSKFNSHFFGAGFKLTPVNGVFGIKHWRSVELRYGHYNRSTGLNSDIISLNWGFK